MALRITGVDGRAARAGVEPGMDLLGINGEPVLDFIDYNWFSAQGRLELTCATAAGQRVFRIQKPAEEPLGLVLDGLYPDEHRCCNRCVFCFVDQLPEGMRDSLYVKDDDWRYSVLFGNYVTLTNVGEREFERIVRRQPSPLYVSVHATDPEVRKRMMGNPRAGNILERLTRLAQAGIILHTQIVLVPGYNDGAVLDRSLRDLFALYPAVRTVAVVPLGMTCHRQGLTQLAPVGQAEAKEAILQVERFAQECRERCGEGFAYAADELYERAGLPPKRYPDGGHTPQLGNGVGMVSTMLDEFEWALEELPASLPAPRRVSIVTGVSAFGVISTIARQLEERLPNLKVNVIRAENRLFGPTVTVAGLLGGADIAAATQGQDLGQEMLFSAAALRTGEDVFLDDMTLQALEEYLEVPVRAVACDGESFVRAVCGIEEEPLGN